MNFLEKMDGLRKMTKEEKLDLYQKLSEIDLELQERFVTQEIGYKDYLILCAGKDIVQLMEDIMKMS